MAVPNSYPEHGAARYPSSTKPFLPRCDGLVARSVCVRCTMRRANSQQLQAFRLSFHRMPKRFSNHFRMSFDETDWATMSSVNSCHHCLRCLETTDRKHDLPGWFYGPAPLLSGPSPELASFLRQSYRAPSQYFYRTGPNEHTIN